MSGTTPEKSGERPLTGIRVIDLLCGPMAAISRHYAELGADVVRLEPEGGADDRSTGTLAGGVSLDFVAANLGKRAGVLGLLQDLAADADILIAPAGGVDVAALHAQNRALVVLSVSDFGATGACAGWRGSGPVFHALSGELSRSGIPGRQPLLPPGNLAIATAAAQAACVALFATWQALKTGEGDHLDFSMLDGAVQALDPGYGISGSAFAGVPASKLPPGRPEARFMYPILPCQDGFVRLCVLSPRQWQGMFAWMGRPDAFADPAFDQLQTRFTSKTLLPAITQHFADKTRAQVEEEAERFGVPAAAVLNLEEALQTAQVAARGTFVPVGIAPDVVTLFPDGVIEVDGVRMGIAGAAPGLPEHSVTWRTRADPPAPDGDRERPFAGVRVLDFGVIVVGAESGRLLADQGADVIKVESSAFPDGSRQSRVPGPIAPTFATGHRNKRSLGLDLRHPEGRRILLDLVRHCDIVLSNFKGGTLQSLGLDYASLRDVNPRIIVADSSAFGPTGPWARRMGYGPLVRASAGLTMQWRYPGEPDSFSDAITVYPDHVAARIGIIGVIALMIRRRRTGQGGQVSVSQSEVMLSHMAPRIAADALMRGGHAVQTTDQAQSAVYACAGDDAWCVVTICGPADEQAAARVTAGVPLSDWCLGETATAAAEKLQAAGVAAGAMLRVSELPGFAYYRERQLFRQTRHPYIEEPFFVEAAPVRADRLPDPPDRPAPLLGEHTAEVLREWLQMRDADIAALVALKVLEQSSVATESESPPGSAVLTVRDCPGYAIDHGLIGLKQ